MFVQSGESLVDPCVLDWPAPTVHAEQDWVS